MNRSGMNREQLCADSAIIQQILKVNKNFELKLKLNFYKLTYSMKNNFLFTCRHNFPIQFI